MKAWPMKRWLLLFFTLTLAACAAPTVQPDQSNLADVDAAPTAPLAKSAYPDLGAAPELAGDTWLNTDAPLRLADLHGKVVLVDMWTFG
jgi:hypothetical protein